jgi:D-alanyl-D-alanine dipeptidase
LLSDPRVFAVPLRESGHGLVTLPPTFGPARARVRSGMAERLVIAAQLLPAGVLLRVVEGHRSIEDQRAIIARYSAEVAESRPGIDAETLEILTSRFVSPVGVAPHVAGAAVDLTLVDVDGVELDMGTVIDATPEQSDGACYFDARQISGVARGNRTILAHALSGAGLVNYPTEWWHWSYGDRYWALMEGKDAALYGPADLSSLAS